MPPTTGDRAHRPPIDADVDYRRLLATFLAGVTFTIGCQRVERLRDPDTENPSCTLTAGRIKCTTTGLDLTLRIPQILDAYVAAQSLRLWHVAEVSGAPGLICVLSTEPREHPVFCRSLTPKQQWFIFRPISIAEHSAQDPASSAVCIANKSETRCFAGTTASTPREALPVVTSLAVENGRFVGTVAGASICWRVEEGVASPTPRIQFVRCS